MSAITSTWQSGGEPFSWTTFGEEGESYDQVRRRHDIEVAEQMVDHPEDPPSP